MIRLLLFIFFINLINPSIQAGWIIVERTSGEGFEDAPESTLYIQNNMIKSVDHDHIMIIDLEKQLLTFINPSINGYWSGPPSGYLSYAKNVMIDYLKAEIVKADEFDKPYLQTMLEDLKFDMAQGNDVVSFIGELPLELIMTDEIDRILGYRANQYLVFLDGERIEEIWFTRDISLENEYDYGDFRSFVDKMSWGGMFQDYRSTERYIHLMKTGIPLRTIETLQDGSVIVTEVVSIEQQHIHENSFRPPSHYKPISLSELGVDLGL